MAAPDDDDPKFSCDACGTEFRWKAELVGKRAKCKCGATVIVPEHPTLTPVADDSADEDDGGSGEYDVAEPEPLPAPPVRHPQTVMPPPGMPPTVVATGAGVVDRRRCPVCGVPGLPTAAICINCGFNFLTGRPPKDRGAEAAAAENYFQAARASWAAPLVAIFLGCCAGGASMRGNAASGLFVALFQLLLIVAGIGCGIYALTGVKRFGKERIVLPAMIGLTINALIVLLNVVIIVLLVTGTVKLEPAGKKAPTKQVPGRVPPVRMLTT
jgi:hypothetical protein